MESSQSSNIDWNTLWNEARVKQPLAKMKDPYKDNLIKQITKVLLPQLCQIALDSAKLGVYKVDVGAMNLSYAYLPHEGLSQILQMFTDLGITCCHDHKKSYVPLEHTGKDTVAHKVVSLEWKEDNQFLDSCPKPPEVKTTALGTPGLAFVEARKDGKQTDIVLSTTDSAGNQTTFAAHRVFLMLGSGFFSTLFESKMKDADEAGLPLQGAIDPEVFEVLLDYMYSGTIINPNWLQMADDGASGSSSEGAKALVPHIDRCAALLYLASQFQVNGIQELVYPHLREALDKTNLLHIGALAHDTNDEYLLKLCKWYVRTHRVELKEMHLGDLDALNLLKVVSVAEALGAVSENIAGHHLANNDSILEHACQCLNARLTDDIEHSLPAFEQLCDYTINLGDSKGSQNLVYKRLKRICREWGRQHLERCKPVGKDLDQDKIDSQDKAYTLFDNLMTRQRSYVQAAKSAEVVARESEDEDSL